jgi:predicted RNA polymerase sigma factor
MGPICDRRSPRPDHGRPPGGRPRRYVLQAAIASLHAETPAYDKTDWPQIVCLYDTLLSVSMAITGRGFEPRRSGIDGLRATRGPAEVEQLEKDGRLAGYHYLPAIKADLLRRLGHPAEAADADRRALELTGNKAERGYLAARLGDLRQP